SLVPSCCAGPGTPATGPLPVEIRCCRSCPRASSGVPPARSWVPDLATKTPGCRPTAVIRVTGPLHPVAFSPSRPDYGGKRDIYHVCRQLSGLSSGGSGGQERVTGALWPVVNTTEPPPPGG